MRAIVTGPKDRFDEEAERLLPCNPFCGRKHLRPTVAAALRETAEKEYERGVADGQYNESLARLNLED